MKKLRCSTTDSDMDSKVCSGNLKIQGCVQLIHSYTGLPSPELLAEGNKGVIPIVAALNEATVQSNGVDEVDAFVNLMLQFLKLNPVERPTAAQALDEPILKHV
jgi:hypothetical protein